MQLHKGVKPSELFNLKVSSSQQVCTWVYDILDTPVGVLLVAGEAPAVSYVAFCEAKEEPLQLLSSRIPTVSVRYSPGIYATLAGLFGGQSLTARIELRVSGTPFQEKVWEQLMEIPYGECTHYGSIAAAIGQPGASRAVGTAVGKNPIAYFIPCHRVLPAGGGIGGYYWGKNVKERVLRLENRG